MEGLTNQQIVAVLNFIEEFLQKIECGDSYWIAPSGERFSTDIGYGYEFWEQISGYLRQELKDK